MKIYLILCIVIFSISAISGIVNYICEKMNTNSLIFEVSKIVANVFGLVSVFLFTGLLMCFC